MGSVVRVYPGPPLFCSHAVAAFGRCAANGAPDDRRGALHLLGGVRSDLRIVDRLKRLRVVLVRKPFGFRKAKGRRQSFGAPVERFARERYRIGAVAQLGEHLLCKQGVSGSIPLSSTIRFADGWGLQG